MKLTTLLTLLIVLTAIGCNNRTEELERQVSTLQTDNTQLTQEITSRDEYVDKVVSDINDVYNSIEEVKAKESSLLKTATALESEKGLTREQVRASVIDKIDVIRATLKSNHNQVAKLQSKLAASTKQYAGLKKMVDNLQKTIAERDQSIADLGKRMESLELDVAQKSRMITEKDSVIDTQYKTIATTYYISGTKDELEQMGIIKDEGGILWGIGSTTTLASGFDERMFKPFNKEVYKSIQVNGRIEEIVPKRSPQFYTKSLVGTDQTLLTIAEPEHFWQDKYLVIITDRGASKN
jgi:peptidoglycan hydrolase CwlO-like protein